MYRPFDRFVQNKQKAFKGTNNLSEKQSPIRITYSCPCPLWIYLFFSKNGGCDSL